MCRCLFTHWSWLFLSSAGRGKGTINNPCRFLCDDCFGVNSYAHPLDHMVSNNISSVPRGLTAAKCMCLLQHQEWTSVPVAPCSCQRLMVSRPAAWHSDTCEEHLTVLMCDSLRSQNPEHLWVSYCQYTFPDEVSVQSFRFCFLIFEF